MTPSPPPLHLYRVVGFLGGHHDHDVVPEDGGGPEDPPDVVEEQRNKHDSRHLEFNRVIELQFEMVVSFINVSLFFCALYAMKATSGNRER